MAQQPFTIGILKQITDQYDAGEISYGKMVEMLNEVAMKWYEQKRLLTEIMEADEKTGLYEATKSQMAVEWLTQQVKSKEWQDMFIWHKEELFKQAKAMEKEQIIDAHIEGQRVFDKHPHTQWTNDQAEQYYNETYDK